MKAEVNGHARLASAAVRNGSLRSRRRRPAGGQAPSGSHDSAACQDRQRAGARLLAEYVHAARDLARAAALAPKLKAASPIPTHATYFADIKIKHARKTSFWPKVQEVGLMTGRRF
jgi:hypothetical protein